MTAKKRQTTATRKIQTAKKKAATQKRKATKLLPKARQTKKRFNTSVPGHVSPLRKKPVRERPANPEALMLARDIATMAQEKKASDVLIIDTGVRAPVIGYDYIVLATGQSERQLDAISQAVMEALKPRNIRASSIEASPNWILMNYDDVVVHFFTQEKRSVYDYEGLWSDAQLMTPRGISAS